MTDLLARLDKLRAEATQTPWGTIGFCGAVYSGLSAGLGGPSSFADAAFIAALSNAYPQLRAVIAAADALADAMNVGGEDEARAYDAYRAARARLAGEGG